MCAIEKSSVIEEELKMCGYFCIITSENMKAKEALELYSFNNKNHERVLAPGGISHSGPGENRQFWPDENSQS